MDDKNVIQKRGVGKKRFEERQLKYDKGDRIEIKQLHRGIKQHKLKKKESKFVEAQETTARAEILLTENSGLLETDDSTHTQFITQRQIKQAVDITAATKSFELFLNDFGPYKLRYSDNGRHLVLGGRKGHLFSMDWTTKKLHYEINVMESIHDVCFLNTEQMMAVAQNRWTYIYDNQGTELHCLKQLHHIVKLEFLPYHFLLCSLSSSHFLSWLDVTIGREIIQTFTKGQGNIKSMCQNPANALICCGHTKGTVTMWTPNAKEPAFTMLGHSCSINSLAFDPAGTIFATSGIDKLLKIWDVRNLGHNISSFSLTSVGDNICFSQTSLLAASMGKRIEVYKDVKKQEHCDIYLKHSSKSIVTGLQFCPYEDILGMSSAQGFESLLIPGSGEANFDALESNPFRSAAARKETVVKRLLEKIPYNMITMDTDTVSQVDVPTAEEKLQAKRDLKWVKVPKMNLQPKYRMKGKSGSAKKFKRKMIMKDDEKRELIKYAKDRKRDIENKERLLVEQESLPPTILDRFKPKNKKIKK